MIKKMRNCLGPGAMEMIQPPQIVFAFQREPMIFEATIKRRHFVSDVVHCDAGPEQIWCEDDASIGQSDLCVLKAPSLFG